MYQHPQAPTPCHSRLTQLFVHTCLSAFASWSTFVHLPPTPPILKPRSYRVTNGFVIFYSGERNVILASTCEHSEQAACTPPPILLYIYIYVSHTSWFLASSADCARSCPSSSRSRSALPLSSNASASLALPWATASSSRRSAVCDHSTNSTNNNNDDPPRRQKNMSIYERHMMDKQHTNNTNTDTDASTNTNPTD